jgi:integrase
VCDQRPGRNILIGANEMHDVTIKKAKPGTTTWDDEVKGLHLRAFAERKSFYLYFRTKAGKERKPKLGDYGVLSLADARRIARDLLRVVAEGKDPLIEREKEKQAPTMQELWERYERDHLPTKKESSRRNDEGLWRLYLAPKLAEKKVSAIGSNDIYSIHKALAEKKATANRVVALASKMLSLAEVWQYRPVNTNPCGVVARNPENKRKRYMKGAEPARIAEELQKEADANPDSVAFIYLLILSGARKSEIAAARWDWLKGNVLELPDSKTGAKSVYLPAQAMTVVDRLRTKNRGTICGMKDPKKLWGKVRTAAGCPDLRMHDLRHSFASAAIKAGLTLAQIGELLGHSSTQTTKRYAHLMEEVAHDSVTKTADVIERMMQRPTVDA